jgi:NADPH:quinone reductase-like Zn-dependent oxidoreductase
MSSQNAAMANNLSVLAHAVELSTKVVMKIAGSDAAGTVNGAPISEASVGDAVAARLQSSLAPYLGA